MKIIIVGAGIGGLSTAIALALAGHKVTVLESAHALAEVGAGVQLTPIASKYFWKWGLGSDLLAHAALPDAFKVRDGTNGTTLGVTGFSGFEKVYGAPYIVLHRADIHKILCDHAVKGGVEVRVNCRVVEYGFEEGSVTLANGEVLVADLVVAADGINSFARRSLLPQDEDDWVEKTGWAAYRATTSVDSLKNDPLTAEVVSSHTCNCFVNSKHLLMTYMVKNSKILNMVLSHPDDVDTSNWSPEEYKAEIDRLIQGWDSSLKTMLGNANPNISNWPIYQVKSLPRWVSESGKFVLIGDAVHGMAFYLSMGVSMAVEDAAALAEVLKLAEETNFDLKRAIQIFETVRKGRSEAVRDASLHGGNILQLPPGADRDARDAALKSDGASCSGDGPRFFAERISYGIVDRKIRDWSYGYDVVEAVRREWKQIGN